MMAIAIRIDVLPSARLPGPATTGAIAPVSNRFSPTPPCSWPEEADQAGLAIGLPVGRDSVWTQIAIWLSIADVDGAIPRRRLASPAPLGTASQLHGRPRRPAGVLS